MKVHFLEGGRLRIPRFFYHPEADQRETMELPVHATLIRHAQGNVLFDSGCSPEASSNPYGRWGELSKVMVPIYSPEQTVVHQLSGLGLTADDIDVVICSHLHCDHCGCNAYFRRATILCHAAEAAAAMTDGAETRGYFRADWDQPQGFQTFSSEHDVFGDERIVLLPMPGHTPGMTIARVVLRTGSAVVLASDAAPLAVHIDEGIRFNSWNVELANAALVELKRFRDQGDTIIYGHDGEQWQALPKGREFLGETTPRVN